MTRTAVSGQVDIYRNSALFTGLRDPRRPGGRCGGCEFRAVGGGSGARAYATTGDILCGYLPSSFPYPEAVS